MEEKTWSVNFGMEASDKSVQNIEEKLQRRGKKRSQADKVGKIKYLLQKIYSLEKALKKSS